MADYTQNGYPQTGSQLYQADGVTNRTGTALSTSIVILVNNIAVGAVQTLSITERRNIKMIPEIGTDGFIDSAPNQATEISGSCDRVRFDRMRAAEAFSRGFIHVASQRIPFDIQIWDKFVGASLDESIITMIKNVWLSEISTNYSATDYVIMDRIQWKAETVMSWLFGGQRNAATGGTRGIPIQIDSVERATDLGQRRGSLDAPGLISAVFNT